MTARRPAPALSRLLFECRRTLGRSMLRSVRPSAHRYSVARLRSSFQSSSRSRCTKAAVHSSGLKAYSCPGTRSLEVLRLLLRVSCERSQGVRAAKQNENVAPSHRHPEVQPALRPAMPISQQQPTSSSTMHRPQRGPSMRQSRPRRRAAAADTDARHRAARSKCCDGSMMPSSRPKKTYWESNGQITRSRSIG
jgi:hypothetical protein